MKKLLSICLVICMALTMVIGLVACKTPQHEHQIKKYWNKDSSGHWKECADPNCKDKFESAEHQWDDGEVSIKATPTRIGKTKYTCTICKFEKTEDTQYVPNSVVTAEKWAELMQLKTDCRITVTQTIPNMEDPLVATIKICGNAVEIDLDATTELGIVNAYTKFDDGKCYNYIYEIKPYFGDMTMRSTYRRSVTEEEWAGNRNVFTYLVDQFENFTYDQTTGTYHADQINAGADVVYTDVTITFADNLISKISYKEEVDGVVIAIECEFAHAFYLCSNCYQYYYKTYFVGEDIKCTNKDKCQKAENKTAEATFQIFLPTDPKWFTDLDNPPAEEGGEGSGDAENAG